MELKELLVTSSTLTAVALAWVNQSKRGESIITLEAISALKQVGLVDATAAKPSGVGSLPSSTEEPMQAGPDIGPSTSSEGNSKAALYATRAIARITRG